MNIINVTFNKAYNYGALLQEYALFSYLKNKNHNVKILNYDDENIKNSYKVLNIDKTNLKQIIRSFLRSLYFGYFINLRNKNFKRFEEKLKFTKEYSENELKNNFNDECDILVAGSDQIWNIDLTNGLNDIYTLNFGDSKIKRISYAASIGNSKIDDKYSKDFKNNLSRFNCISLREKSGAKEIKRLLPNRDVSVVIDPTLLLDKDNWSNLIKDKSNNCEKYIFAYMVAEDEEFYKIVNNLSKKTGLKVINVEIKKIKKAKNSINNVLKYVYTIGPDKFVEYVSNAEYVVTTSFHATVFSIIFGRKFWVIPNKKTGSRVTNLLEKLKLEDRYIDSLEEFKEKNYNSEIDYDKVNKRLNKMRKNSEEWLKNAINGDE